MEQDSSSLNAVYLVLCLMYMAWVMWHLLLPEHRRQAARLRLLRSCARAMSGLARRAGAASLSREAATGVADYSVPYHLSLARLRFERAYDRARQVTL
jgi:hypothetical protein